MLAGQWQAANFEDDKPLRCRELLQVNIAIGPKFKSLHRFHTMLLTFHLTTAWSWLCSPWPSFQEQDALSVVALSTQLSLSDLYSLIGWTLGIVQTSPFTWYLSVTSVTLSSQHEHWLPTHSSHQTIPWYTFISSNCAGQHVERHSNLRTWAWCIGRRRCNSGNWVTTCCGSSF